MLVELIVENYAVVEQARIRFQTGLNVLTGETGSGKSIVVDSLGLLLGARASTEMIRSGEARARVSGIFSLENAEEISELLSQAGVDYDGDEELFVEREISAGGKSRAFVANRPMTTAFLRQLAPALADIHGQNEQQLLFTPSAQREILDEYAGLAELRRQVGETYSELRATEAQLDELLNNEQDQLRLLDLWTFQRKEIEGVQPRSGEDAELEAEKKILQNVTRLAENAGGAFTALYESPESATTQLRAALKRVEDLVRIDDGLAEVAASLKQAVVLADDAALVLRDYAEKLEADPGRLEDVETRLAALDRLKRKYGRTLEEVLAFCADVGRRMDEVEHATERGGELERRRAEIGTRYEKLATELSGRRSSAGAKLSAQVQTELRALAMGGTQFRVELTRGSWNATGFDEVGFLVSPNRGEELKPLARIASGGELSRIALALKTAVGDSDKEAGIHTLVFDEVDAGVGGAAAAAVGKRLKALSRTNQVICVTHLAQIAGFADHHYAVSKRERKGRVTTEVVELPERDRAREIGRMLSGEHITDEALKHAEQLMQAGKIS